MSVALDMIEAGGGPVDFIVHIEGYGAILTSGKAVEALNVWQGSTRPGCYTVSEAYGGLSVEFDQDLRSSPWQPFDQPPVLRLIVVPAEDSSGVVSDRFAVDCLRRSHDVETGLTASITPTSTTFMVQSEAGFTAPGRAYVGAEQVLYTGTAAGELTGVERGWSSPFQTFDGSAAYSRAQVVRDASTATGDPLGVALPIPVTSGPGSFVGRWVGVWICKRFENGQVYGSGPDDGHLAFAGTIASVKESESGAIVIECEHALRRIYETRVMADPWTAAIADGFYLDRLAGFDTFTCTTVRNGTPLTANPLSIVSGAPASVNEIQIGFYTAAELGQAITAWLQSEYNAGRIHFSTRYDATRQNGSQIRGRVSASDLTAGTVYRSLALEWPFGGVQRFLGWFQRVYFGETSSTTTHTVDAPEAPRRILSSYSRVQFVNERGTWVNQASLLPAPLVDAAGFAEGVVRFGGLGHAVVSHGTDYLRVRQTPGNINDYLTGPDPTVGLDVTMEDDQEIVASQVLVMEASFQDLLLQLLYSTGAAAFNHADYDTLPATLGCAIPGSLLPQAFIDEVAGLSGADATLTAFVEKPTRICDLFNVDFLLRFAFLTWGAGRVHAKAWGTPTAGAAVIDLTEDNKAIAIQQQGDKQRASSDEKFEFIRNLVTVNFGRNAAGDLTSHPSFSDLYSVAQYGPRGIVLDAENTLGQSIIGDMAGILARFAATMPLFSRPHKVITRTLDLRLFEQCVPGTYCTITDAHIRSPDTGQRGITGWPGVVVGVRFDWGGSSVNGAGPRTLFGEVDVMIFDRISEAPYCPTAQFNGTDYNAGTKTITCQAHEHSASSDPVDASRFVANDVVRILEIDPASPSGALTWVRTVQTVSGNDITISSGLSSPSFDTAKKYRIVSADYGSAASSQHVNAYQADDATGLVASTRQPYAFMASGTGQSATFTGAAATELPARYSDQQIGDGVPVDTGAARDAARLANNAISYRTAPQLPVVYSEAQSIAVSGTRALLGILPVPVGMGTLSAAQSLPLYVAPMIRSKTGASVTVRISLCRNRPGGASLQDVILTDPYVSASFTTSSTTYVIPTATALDCGHLALTSSAVGGVGWLAIEAESSNLEFGGLPVLYVGPMTNLGGAASSLISRPGIVEWQRDALNAMYPSATFVSRLAHAANHLTAYRHRCALARSWRLGDSTHGASGTTTTLRWRFRSGHGVDRLRVMVLMGLTATGGTGTNPRATFTIDGGSSQTWYYGLSPTAATDAPDELAWFLKTFTISPDTAYTGKLEEIDYGRVLAIVAYEVGADTVSEATEWFIGSNPQARSPIYDQLCGRMLQGLSEIHRHNAGTVAHWALKDGSSRTRSSATQINLIDNSTTGLPTSSTPGHKIDMTYRATTGKATVSIEAAAYGSMASGTGVVKLIDSAGSTVLSINVNSSTPGWFTATAEIPATLDKYDWYYAGDGANTLSVSAVSLIEWEA